MMGILIEVPQDIITAVPGKRIRLNIQVEHPSGTWNEILVDVDFNQALGLPSFSRRLERNEAGFSSMGLEFIVPSQHDFVVPSERRELRIGELTVTRNGEKRSEQLPKLRILAPESYFEEIVAEMLRSLGYEVQRYGGPRNPDLVAYHADQPNQKIEVEATTESSYGLSKYRSDVGKFHGLKHPHNLQRLLIVTRSQRIEPGVIKQLKRVHDPFTLVCYGDLEKLRSKYVNCQISKFEVVSTLSQSGFARVT